MPISDYVNAFFFDRRTRVAHAAHVHAQVPSLLQFAKLGGATTGDNFFAVIARSLKHGTPHIAVRIRAGKDVANRKLWRDPAAKKKKPGVAGLFDEFLFLSVHFASLAI